MTLNVWRDRWYIRAEVQSIRHALVSFTAPESECVPAHDALDIVAHDVTVTVEAPTGTKVETLNRFPVRKDGSRLTVLLGDLVSRQDVEVVFRLAFPAGPRATTIRAVFSVADAHGIIQAAETAMTWAYADHRPNDLQPRHLAVDRAVAKLDAANAIAKALELNGAGRFDDAVARLRNTAGTIASYAGTDGELHAIVGLLRNATRPARS